MSDSDLRTHKSVSRESALHFISHLTRRWTLSCLWKPSDGHWDSPRYQWTGSLPPALRQLREKAGIDFNRLDRSEPFPGTSAHHGGLGSHQRRHSPILLTGAPAGYRRYQAWVAHRLPFPYQVSTGDNSLADPDWIRASVYDSVSATTTKNATQQQQQKSIFFKKMICFHSLDLSLLVLLCPFRAGCLWALPVRHPHVHVLHLPAALPAAVCLYL